MRLAENLEIYTVPSYFNCDLSKIELKQNTLHLNIKRQEIWVGLIIF